MAQGKTKEYQKRAAYKYNEAHDKIQFFIDKGEKKRWAAVGLDSNALRELIRAEYKRRIGATDILPQSEPESVEEIEVATTPDPEPQTEATPEPKREHKLFMPKPTTDMSFFD